VPGNGKEYRIKLTQENYHSPAARREYLSSSRVKDFLGCPGIMPCESRALALEKGDWMEEPTAAMKASSYVDAHISGTMDVFKAQTPDMFTKKGELYAAYKNMDNVIARIERDEYFMKMLSGEKQRIFTGELFGAKWSIMVDSYIEDVAIVDLKVMAEIKKLFWVRDLGHVSFVEYYGYLFQAALYARIVEINTGKRLPFFIAAASKEACPDIEIIGFRQQDLDDALSLVEPNIPRILQLKAGEVPPDSCGRCDWCKTNKKLSKPVHFTELIQGV